MKPTNAICSYTTFLMGDMAHALLILRKMEEHALAATASSVLEVPWEAQYAEAKLIGHKARQAETDENTPGLSLLFEDAAFAKLAASSSKVKAAKATVRRIERSQSAALRQLDVNIGSAGLPGHASRVCPVPAAAAGG